mmetsp:Transcript_77267/g.134892  ORF Transcript_77267/g.134892 Transcript_77267/m.134892 type:complete len:81 (-) Transcript_77267:17-259(-)
MLPPPPEPPLPKRFEDDRCELKDNDLRSAQAFDRELKEDHLRYCEKARPHNNSRRCVGACALKGTRGLGAHKHLQLLKAS